MANRRITDHTALTGGNTASTDLIEIIDVSDTTDAATGTNKKQTIAEHAIAIATHGALATDAELAAHESDTTSVHGIADTSILLTTTAHDSRDHSAALSTAVLDDLSDVTITAAASGDILRHNGTAWVDAVGTTHFEVAGAVATHEADTTSVHGIADTSTLYRSGGTDVAVADGGTGASDASTARTNLGVDYTTLDERTRDVIGTALVAGSNITITPNDGADTITIAASGGGGSVATDTIFDAKGDLAVGTGSDTASKLSVGTNGYILSADSGEATGLEWIPNGGPARVGGFWTLASQVVSTATATDLTWTTEVSDTNGFLTPSSTTVTIPAGLGGLYQISVTLVWSAQITTRGFMNMTTTPTAGAFRSIFTGEDVYGVTNIIPLSAGDTIVISVFQQTGSNKTVTSAGLYVNRLGA